MYWITSRVMESNLQGTQIQIGQDVYVTRRALQGATLAWARQLCRGLVRSKN